MTWLVPYFPQHSCSISEILYHFFRVSFPKRSLIKQRKPFSLSQSVAKFEIRLTHCRGENMSSLPYRVLYDYKFQSSLPGIEIHKLEFTFIYFWDLDCKSLSSLRCFTHVSRNREAYKSEDPAHISFLLLDLTARRSCFFTATYFSYFSISNGMFCFWDSQISRSRLVQICNGCNNKIHFCF